MLSTTPIDETFIECCGYRTPPPIFEQPETLRRVKKSYSVRGANMHIERGGAGLGAAPVLRPRAARYAAVVHWTISIDVLFVCSFWLQTPDMMADVPTTCATLSMSGLPPGAVFVLCLRLRYLLVVPAGGSMATRPVFRSASLVDDVVSRTPTDELDEALRTVVRATGAWEFHVLILVNEERVSCATPRE